MKTKNLQQDKFQIIFDGSAFSEGTIQARVFANSLLALDDIFSAIVKEKHGKEAEIHLQITALKPGSFLVDILCSSPRDMGASDHYFYQQRLPSNKKNNIVDLWPL